MLQDRHADLQPPSHPAKTKKSLAEKISRTLDKIAAVTSSPVSLRDVEGRRSRGAGGPGGSAGVVYPVYAGYSPGYRTVRGPHGVSYQYVYTGWDPASLYHQETSSAHFLPVNNYCRCSSSSGSDSLRSRSGQVRCKKCSKPKTPYSQSRPAGGKVRARLQMPGDQHQHHHQPHHHQQQSAGSGTRAGPKDPYDYIRRTRLKADDWDTYWENSGPDEMTPAYKQSPATSKSAPSHHNIKHSRSSPEARRVVSQFDPRSIQTPNSSSGSKLEPSQDTGAAGERRQQPLEMRQNLVTACDLMEDEDSSQPESKPISNCDSQGQSESLQDKNNNKNNSDSGESGDSLCDASQDSESDLSAVLLADLQTMKSKISVAEMRYRKFQRRNPLRKLSLQIDEVIIEEDEEALENEDLENQSLSLTSSLPPVCENDEEKSSTSSDDEFGIGKFKKVIGDSNFADEILSEIYGATGEGGGSCSRPAGESLARGGGEGEGEEGNTIRSLADEILDELYGTRDVGEEEEEEEERQESPEYCNIEDLRSEEGRAESEAEESLRAGEYNTDLTAG